MAEESYDERVKAVLQKHGIPTDNDEADIYTRYAEMADAIRAEPSRVTEFCDLFAEVFVYRNCGLIVRDGEYSIYWDDNDGMVKFTEFAVVVLDVKRVYDLARPTEYFLTLAVLSPYDQPQVVSLKSTQIGRYTWIDTLGATYFYKPCAITWIKKAIQTMAIYAPKIDEFKYSGWSPDIENTYILEGAVLCATK